MATFTGSGGPAVGARGGVPVPTGVVRYGGKGRSRETRSPWGARPAAVVTAEPVKGRPGTSRRAIQPRLMTISPDNCDRYRAVIAGYLRGQPYLSIAGEVGVSRVTINRWVAHHVAGGLAPDDEERLRADRVQIVEEVVRHGRDVEREAEALGVPVIVARRWVQQALETREAAGE